MLSLYGFTGAVKNTYCLARLVAPGRPLESLESIHEAYLDFLEKYQPRATPNRSGSLFVRDPETEDRLSNAFCESSLNDLGQEALIGSSYSPDLWCAKTALASRALSELFTLDDSFASVFSLAIHSVFVRPSKPGRFAPGSHGGSSSTSIGSIWLTVNDGLAVIDLMEMFVHEVTHHLLFIDELNHLHFNYLEIAKEENFARSAILRRNRPLDKVIHSVVVAAELLRARRVFLNNDGPTTIHPDSRTLADNALAALDSVAALPNLPNLLTPRVQEILTKCRPVFEESSVALS